MTEIITRSKKWYNAHKEEAIERTTRWRNENKEVVAANRKRLYDANPEKYRIQRKESYARNKEKEQKAALDRLHRRMEENPEEVLKVKRKWYETNQDRNRNYAHNRRAKVRNVTGGHFTDAEFQQICEENGNKCLCCGRTDVQLTADHIIPLGPPHSDEKENIQPLCLSCNSKKSTKTIDYR